MKKVRGIFREGKISRLGFIAVESECGGSAKPGCGGLPNLGVAWGHGQHREKPGCPGGRLPARLLSLQKGFIHRMKCLATSVNLMISVN